MASTVFSPGTVVASTWLNDVNSHVYKEQHSVWQYGAVADGNVTTGTGTDNSPFFQAAINALGVTGVLYIPAGIYLLQTRLQIPSEFTMIGAGNFDTILTCKNAYNDPLGLIHLNGVGGPPTIIKDLAIVAQLNGAGAVSTGLNMAANGSFAKNLWVSGFATNVLVGSSDCFLLDSAVEETISGGTGVSVTAGAATIANCTIYNCYVGIAVSASFTGGTTSISNTRTAACSFTGMLMNGAANVQIVNCSSAHNNTSRYTFAGITVQNSTNVHISNYIASLSVASSSATGCAITNSTDISVTGGTFYNWQDGIKADTTARLSIVGVHCSNNTRRGIFVDVGCDMVVIEGNICSTNGTGATSDAGIYSSNTASFTLHNINGNICSQTAGGVQDYGIFATLTDNAANSGKTMITGNICQYAATAEIQISGLVKNIVLSGNIPEGAVGSNAIFPISIATYSVGFAEKALVGANAGAGMTITLPPVASNIGRVLTLTTNVAQVMVSNASNVVPITGAAAGTAILAATPGKWAQLICDGAAWRISAAN